MFPFKASERGMSQQRLLPSLSVQPVDLELRIFSIKEKSVWQENNLPFEFDFHALLNVYGSNYSGFIALFFFKENVSLHLFFLIMKGI